MVLTWQNSDRTKATITARGNFSLDADGLVSLLLALAVVSMGLGCHRIQCRQDHGDAAKASEKTPG